MAADDSCLWRSLAENITFMRKLTVCEQNISIPLTKKERENIVAIPNSFVLFVADAEQLLFCGRNCHLSKSYLSHEVNDSKGDG